MLVSALAVLSGMFVSTSGLALAAKPLPLGSPVTIVTPTGGAVTRPRLRVSAAPRVRAGALTAARFVSPRSGLVTGRSVVVTVLTKPRLRSLRVRVNGHVVTGSFRRVAAGRWSAVLRVGRELRPGVSVVSMVARDLQGGVEAGSLRLIVGRVDSRLLSVSVRRRAGEWFARVGVRATPALVAVTVNGRAEAALFSPLVKGSADYPLGIDDGLRFGANVLRFTVARDSGAYRRVVVRFIVPPDRPLVGARDAHTLVGSTVRLRALSALSGGASGAAPLSWALVRAPAGSHAHLAAAPRGLASAAAHASSAAFTPARPGAYVFRLTAGRGRAASADTVTVDASAAYPPIGAAVETIASEPGSGLAIDVGANCTAVMQSCAHNTYPYGSGRVQLLILDRQTLAVESDQTYAGSSSDASAAFSTLIAEAHKPIPGIAILAALPGSNIDSSWQFAFDLLVFSPLAHASHGGWSAIGIPNTDNGPGGIENPGDNPQPGSSPAGDMHGSLQFNAADGYWSFVSGDYAAYDTSAPGAPATSNLITVGSQSFLSGALSGCAGGYQLVILKAETLTGPTDYPANNTFLTNCPGVSDNALEWQYLGDALNRALGDAQTQGPELVFLQSLGTPFDGTTQSAGAAATISPLIARLGGTSDVFNTANLTASMKGYALAGSTVIRADAPFGEPQYYAPEAASEQNQGPAFLQGLLQRNRNWHFTPVLGAAANADAATVPTVVYTPASPWPTGATVDQQHALSYISGPNVLDLEYSPQSSCYEPTYPDVRFEYCDTNVLANADAEADQVASTAYTPACNCSAQAWAAVTADIAQELRWVGKTYSYFQAVKEVYNSVGTETALINWNQIATTITDAVDPPSDSQVSGYWTGLSGSILYVAALFSGETGSAVLGGIGAIANLVSGLLSSPDGSTGLGQIVNTNASNFANQIQTRYATAWKQLGHFRDIIVGNYGALRAAGQSPDFQLDHNAIVAEDSLLTLAAYRYAYEELLGAPPFVAWYLMKTPKNPNPVNPTQYVCNVQDIQETRLFHPATPGDWTSLSSFDPPVPQFGNGTPGSVVIAVAHRPGVHYHSPPQSIMGPLESTPVTFDSNGVPQTFGEWPIWLFTHSFTPKGISCS